MAAYNTKFASIVTGASERQLRYWDRLGIIRPSVGAASGRGSRRLYSFFDLIQARAAKKLRDEGLSLQRLRQALHALKEKPEQVKHPLAELTLITDGSTVFMLTDDRTALEDVLGRGQLVSALAIKPLCDYVRQQVTRGTRKLRSTVEVAFRKYRVVIGPDVVDGGFIAECPSLPGCLTDGETQEEALCNIKDAIAIWREAGRRQRHAQAQ